MSETLKLSTCALAGLLFATLMWPSIGSGQPLDQQGVLTREMTDEQFIANPGHLLQQYPTGGPQMALLVQRLAVDDASLAPVIVSLLASADAKQKVAIAEGLARAAKIFELIDQARVLDIQRRLEEINDSIVNVAFAKAFGETALGATVSAPLPIGGGVGGQTNQLGNNPARTGLAQPIGTPGTTTPAFTYNSSVVPANNAPTPPGGTARSVSATTIP